MPGTSAALIDQLVYIDNFFNNGSGDTPQLDVDGQLSLDLAAFADDSFIFPDEDKPKKSDHDDDVGDDANAKPGDENRDFSKENLYGSSRVPRLEKHISQDLDTKWLDGQRSNSTNHNSRENVSEGQKALTDLNLRSRNFEVPESISGSNDGLSFPVSATYAAGPVNVASPKSHGDFIAAEFHNDDVKIPDLSHLPKFPVPPGAESSLIQAGLSHNQIDLLAALIAQHQSTLGQTNISKERLGTKPTEPMNESQSTSSLSTILAQNPILPGQPGLREVMANGMVDSPESGSSSYSTSYATGSFISTPKVSRRSSNGGSNGANYTELDKRKKNTEASARFRVKRKLREKEMENRIQQLDDLIEKFQVKITGLETENRLLKNLIIEKGDQRSSHELEMLKERAKRD